MTYAKHGNTPKPNRQQLYDAIVGKEDDIAIIVGRLLTTLGFKSNLTGTQYLKGAILYRYSNAQTVCVGMITDTYKIVADKYNTVHTRVERAIRHSIINCYTNGDLKLFNELVQASIIDEEFAPSNGEFICSVVNWLQLEKLPRRDIGRE